MTTAPHVPVSPIDLLRPSSFKFDHRAQRVSRAICASWVKLDLLLLSFTLLMLLLGPEIRGHQLSFARVLQLRVSLLNFMLAATCLIAWRLSFNLTKLHFDRSTASVTILGIETFLRVTSCAGIAAIIMYLRHPDRVSVSMIATFWFVSMILLSVGRAILIAFEYYVRPLLRQNRQVVIVGSGRRAQQVAHELTTHPKWHYFVLGFVDSEPQCDPRCVLGGIEQLDSILMQKVVDEVIIALPMKSMYDSIQQAIQACERAGIQSGYSLDLFSTEVAKRRSFEEHDASSVVLHMVHNGHHKFLKRSLDVACSAIGVIILAPLMLLVAIAIKMTSKGPVIFRQKRYGLNKRTFWMYKFRSMVEDAEVRQKELEHLNENDGHAFKMRNDPRITRVGQIIRRTSIDELPQFFNVLLGDMSLVGPRPLPMRDVNNFSEASLMRRFSVKPGLTGLWQVSGRSNTSFANWMKLDLEYIDRWSLLLDMKILARTIPAVFKKSGAV